jgi:hypothetical protein
MILETAAKYGVPLEMLWKPSGGSNLLPAPEPAAAVDTASGT